MRHDRVKHRRQEAYKVCLFERPILGGPGSLAIEDRTFDHPFTGKASHMCDQGVTAWDGGGR
jgi:hypothetical protein